MNALRSLICVIWGVVLLIPLATALLLSSIFIRGDRLYWWYAIPFLKLVIGAVRLVGGVDYRIHGWENLPAKDDNQRIILCPKHQSAWETFAFPTLMPHALSYVFKKELLAIPFFGWAIGRLDMVHIDRSNRSEAWAKVAQQGRALMDTGHWLIMLPEGTRIERGERGAYKTGASRLAVLTGAAIVPIAVTSARCWPRRSFSLRPGVIDISVGAPIPSQDRNADDMMAEVEAWIETEMRRLDPEAYDRVGQPAEESNDT
jgi:1-acyl-sn-glycerol-3-phosphate acyltransferase